MNKMITRIIALILTLGLFTGCASTLPQPDMDLDLLDEIQQRGTLIIGTEGTYSPNSYHDESGTLVGFDVEVAQAVAAKLGGGSPVCGSRMGFAVCWDGCRTDRRGGQ
ncbi:transporter substrate-binding domain-containing protein [Holdemania massiliensis]|uniref:transporter substrate-binding domain-containing protein n=1 Tax=Holdemania massiliensis TaxID=1468449 RepID=UPI003561BB29